MGLDLGRDWFSNRAIKKVGNGDIVCFCHDVWVGEAPLKAVLMRPFSISTKKGCSVQELRG